MRQWPGQHAASRDSKFRVACMARPGRNLAAPAISAPAQQHEQPEAQTWRADKGAKHARTTCAFRLPTNTPSSPAASPCALASKPASINLVPHLQRSNSIHSCGQDEDGGQALCDKGKATLSFLCVGRA